MIMSPPCSQQEVSLLQLFNRNRKYLGQFIELVGLPFLLSTLSGPTKALAWVGHLDFVSDWISRHPQDESRHVSGSGCKCSLHPGHFVTKIRDVALQPLQSVSLMFFCGFTKYFLHLG